MLYSYPIINFTDIKPNDNWSFKEAKRSQTNYVSHGYHRYPAKFIPQIVRKLIRQHCKTDGVVFDPFGGCGTTLVEAKILGRSSIGYDINPVAKLITKAKIRAIEPSKLSRSWDKMKSLYSKSQQTGVSPRKHSDKIKHWFEEDSIRQLDLIFDTVIDISDYRIRDFYVCAFSNILKNSSRWLMSSTKPQIDPDKVVQPIFETFSRQVSKMIKKNENYYKLLKKKGNLNVLTKMYLRDSTKKFDMPDNSIDIVITSPPYVTSYEYADLHQLTTFWLADYKEMFPRWEKYAENFQDHRSDYIGSKYGDRKRNFNLISETANSIVDELYANNSRHKKSVTKYYSDMDKSFKHIYRVIKPSGKLCMVIGNTTLSGVKIKNAEVATEQLTKIGFKMEHVIKRELSNKMITPYRDKKTGKFTNQDNPNSKRVYKYEYIIIARKKISS